MKTCSLSEAKRSLGKLADEALAGRPTVISHGGKLLILRAYEAPDPDAFDALIDEGISSEHSLLTDSIWESVRQRGNVDYQALERVRRRKQRANRAD
jgi:hypothetical protein